MDSTPAAWDPAELSAHAPWIRSLALRLVRDAGRADDLVQEAFLAALEQRPAADRPLRPWLRGVLAKRLAFGVRSDARRRARECDRAPNEEQPPSQDLAEQAETHARLVQSLARLREPYRTALLLRYYEGLAPKEIAQRLGLPGATVRSHLKRGLDELRAQLEGEQPDERRAWCVALCPLAAAASDAGAFTNPLTSCLEPLRAMNPLVHVIAASSALLIGGTFVAGRLGGGPPITPSPTVSEATTDAHAASVPAVKRAASSSVPGGSNSAPVDENEVVVGFVRESETGAPTRGYAVRIGVEGDGGEGELLWTDEAGRFESANVYAPGTAFRVRLQDHPELCWLMRTERDVSRVTNSGSNTTRTWEPTEGPLDLFSTVGPTFTLALDAPFELDPAQLVATLEASERAPFGPLANSTQLRAPVRSGESLWTRFSRHVYFLPTNRPWLLRVETTDGLWAGEVEVAAIEGEHPETIAMELVPAARLDAMVVSETEYLDVVVIAERIEDGTRHVMWRRSGEELPDGGHQVHFQLMALPEGPYQLTVSSEGTEEVATNVLLVAGQVHEETIELAPSPGLSHVRGELRSVSGQYHDPMTLYLTGLATGTVEMRMTKWVEQDGVFVAPFTFDNLPVDSYTVSLFSFSDRLRWEGSASAVSPPAEGLVLTCRDTDPVRRVEIHVKDAATGAAIPLGYASMTAAGCASAQMLIGAAGHMVFEKVPVDAAIEWWASAEGFVPAFGDESALVVDGDLGVITAALQPGWGARIFVTDSATHQPLGGVSVQLDGAPAGTTDTDGHLDLAAPTAPAHVDLELEGWQFEAGSYDPTARALTGVLPTYPIQLSQAR